MTRKAIILSAGQGKRLLPLTEQRPKCLPPLGGRTILEWCEVDFPKDLPAADRLSTWLWVEQLWASGESAPLCSQLP